MPLQLTALAVRAVALAAGLEPLVEAAAVEALAAGAAAQARQLAGGGLDDGVANEALLLACMSGRKGRQKAGVRC